MKLTRSAAMMSQDGYARAIRPVHTPFDGDTLFAISTEAVPVAQEPVTCCGSGRLRLTWWRGRSCAASSMPRISPATSPMRPAGALASAAVAEELKGKLGIEPTSDYFL